MKYLIFYNVLQVGLPLYDGKHCYCFYSPDGLSPIISHIIDTEFPLSIQIVWECLSLTATGLSVYYVRPDFFHDEASQCNTEAALCTGF